MIEWKLVCWNTLFKEGYGYFDGAQVRLPTQLAFVVEDGKMKEGKRKAADAWEVKTVFISGGWLEVTQVEPLLLPYTFRSSHVNPPDPKKSQHTTDEPQQSRDILPDDATLWGTDPETFAYLLYSGAKIDCVTGCGTDEVARG